MTRSSLDGEGRVFSLVSIISPRPWRAARMRALLAFLVAALAGSGCGDTRGSALDGAESQADSSVSAVDDAGRTVRLERPARRVIALLPSLTETMVALGAAELLVARTDYDLGLGVDDLPSVGGGLTPSLEAFASLQPDLVIAWEEAGGPRVRLRLEELGIPVFAVHTRDTAAVFQNIARVGALIGREAAAAELTTHLHAELDEVRATVAGLEKPSVLLLIGTDPPMVAASELFITEMIEVAGGRTAFPDLRHSPQVSLEEIVRRRPDVVLLPVSDRSAGVVDRLRRTPGWRELLAQPGVRVATIPAEVVYRPGPSIAAAARHLRDAIHPAATPTGDR